MRQPRIVVIGGSLVGPTAALLLHAKGYTDVTVIDANPRAYSQSGGVMGVRYSTLDKLNTLGITTPAIQALTSPDVYAFDVNHSEQPDLRGVSAFPGMVTSWDALHTELAHRVDVTRGHTATGLVDDAGRTYIVCTCGRQHDADLIIWADGRKSTGRTLLSPERPLTYNGYVVWRGLVDIPAPRPQGFHRYYDIEGGRLFSLTEPVVQTGKSYFEFSHNLDAEVWEQITGRRPDQFAYMLPSYVRKHPEVMDVIRYHASGLPHRFEHIIETSEISGIPVNDVAMPERVLYPHKSGAMSVLVGDAAIPVRLQVGAGLNQGVQQVSDFIDAYGDTHQAASLRTWETEHMAELARWVELGRSRAQRNNLGWYIPVRKGRTAVPRTDQWTPPRWVTA